jgi:glycosyltransferase involved in cell wall biosynthesis
MNKKVDDFYKHLSMKKKKLLIIETGQFGNLTDVVKWCEYLRDEYAIAHIGFNTGRKKIQMAGVRDFRVPAIKPKIIRGALFFLCTIIKVFFHRGKIIVVYFPMSGLLKKIFPHRRMLLDIRTLAVSPNHAEREIYDQEVKNTCKVFDQVSAISKGVANKLERKDIRILPLGADCISNKRKNYTDSIRLLYVGTINRVRHIEKTIEGVHLFHIKHPLIKINYTIVGDGKNGEKLWLEKIISEYGLENTVSLEGRIPHNELSNYFDNSNIGVSFVPITDYFQYQPPTKTFEYIMSGLYCIATNTISNAEIVTSKNGILIDDSSEAFSKALEEYWNKRTKIMQTDIENSIPEYAWPHIVKSHLKPILENL